MIVPSLFLFLSDFISISRRFITDTPGGFLVHFFSFAHMHACTTTARLSLPRSHLITYHPSALLLRLMSRPCLRWLMYTYYTRTRFLRQNSLSPCFCDLLSGVAGLITCLPNLTFLYIYPLTILFIFCTYILTYLLPYSSACGRWVVEGGFYSHLSLYTSSIAAFHRRDLP